MKVSVTCYAGYRGEEMPRRIVINDRKIFVRFVKYMWRTPEYRYFKISGDDGKTYCLRYDGLQWELV